MNGSGNGALRQPGRRPMPGAGPDLPEGVIRLQGQKLYATWPKTLDAAHQQNQSKLVRFLGITSEIVQIPCAENEYTAVVTAQVTWINEDGDTVVFSGIGDACPRNVRPEMVHQLLRYAATRAQGRALRDSVNIGEVLEEEMDGRGDGRFDGAPYEERRDEKEQAAAAGRGRAGQASAGQRPGLSEEQRAAIAKEASAIKSLAVLLGFAEPQNISAIVQLAPAYNMPATTKEDVTPQWLAELRILMENEYRAYEQEREDARAASSPTTEATPPSDAEILSVPAEADQDGAAGGPISGDLTAAPSPLLASLRADIENAFSLATVHAGKPVTIADKKRLTEALTRAGIPVDRQETYLTLMLPGASAYHDKRFLEAIIEHLRDETHQAQARTLVGAPDVAEVPF